MGQMGQNVFLIFNLSHFYFPKYQVLKSILGQMGQMGQNFVSLKWFFGTFFRNVIGI